MYVHSCGAYNYILNGDVLLQVPENIFLVGVIKQMWREKREHAIVCELKSAIYTRREAH